MKQIDASKIEIVQIKTLKGNIDAAEDASSDMVESYAFDFELGTGLNLEDKLVGLKLIIGITALAANDQPLNIKGSYTHEIIFRVDNLEEFVEKKDNIGVIDGAMGGTLVGIAYSTVRGIIFTRTQGTSLGAVILPVINPAGLMENNNKTEQQADKTE